MTAHSITGGSNAHVWVHCPGAALLMRLVHTVETPAMARGTLLHAAAAGKLNGDGTEYYLTPKEQAKVDEYVAHATLLCGGMRDHASVELFKSHQEYPGAFGSIDFVTSEGGKVHIVDFKSGKTPVSATWNWQLLYYAYLYSVNTPTLHICQLGNCNSWTPTTEEWTIARTKIYAALKEVWEGPATLKKGGQCDSCKARRICPAQQQEAVEVDF